MADVIKKSTNKFTKGLVMDFSPENTKNELLTHALNATLLTFNGNELSLQNDMGNARVETAYLPEGYMPVGTCEYGGIIYIVSYNPLEDKSQIGCFPSPERNVSNDELGIADALLSKDKFQVFKGETPTGELKNSTSYVLLKNDNLNPGDKFLVCSGYEIYDEKLADLYKSDDGITFEPVENPVLALNVVSIEESGKIAYLNSDIRQYTTSISTDNTSLSTYRYHILGDNTQDSAAFNQSNVDIDSYRNVMSSGYSVFKSKTSGKLAILAELITIDSYSVTHSVRPKKDAEGNDADGSFDVIIHTDITPEVTENNYNIVPKLKYYYLQKSQGYVNVKAPEYSNAGYVQLNDQSWAKTLFNVHDLSTYNPDFFSTVLSDIFISTDENNPLKLTQTLDQSGRFNFPATGSYHSRMEDYDGNLSDVAANDVYVKFTGGAFHRINKSQVSTNFSYYNNELRAKFYRYAPNNEEYVALGPEEEVSDAYEYYLKDFNYTYTDAQRNEAYSTATLFDLTSVPILIEDDSLLSESSIEKYTFVTRNVYSFVPESEWSKYPELWSKEGNTYTRHTSYKSGQIYYFAQEMQNYESIGFIVKREDYPNDSIYYYPTTKEYIEVSDEVKKDYFNFDKYPLSSTDLWGYFKRLYYRTEQPVYSKAPEEDLSNYPQSGETLYYKPDYVYVHPNSFVNTPETGRQWFMVVGMDTYIPVSKFMPSTSANYIKGYAKPGGEYPKDDPISLHTVADFIPTISENKAVGYNDVVLANVKLPGVLSLNNIDLPFKYDYTVVPCMNYGRLDHLAVSNTVDFSKLHAFDQSNFTTWKYHIDENQLRLTFGADIHDTFETYKVDGLILEFYDLRGFAGSLEITDKKSYSGVFTKLLSLNSLNALSNKRVWGDGYSTSFKHNINIVQSGDKFLLNDEEVWFSGHEEGWKFVNGSRSLADTENDVGVLYSNIIYGVKTYLRQTIDGKYKFIPKKDFFIYTIPILNEFYYSVNDFSGIENPQLDFILTYKLQDSSTYTPYTEGSILDGYCSTDIQNVDNYCGGFYTDSSLDAIRYYKYQGTSKLSLEIGLKQEYQNYSLSYTPDINKLFTCKLQLVSDESADSTFSVKGDGVTTEQKNILKYTNKDNITIDLSVNKLGIGNSLSNTVVVGTDNDNFSNYNFINNPGTKTIPINYEFVVGYPITIDSIRATEISATTVCALLHQNSNGVYNYEDFGIYEQTENDEIVYLSDNMFFNGGTSYTEEFGTCRLVKTTSGNMLEQCQITKFTSRNAGSTTSYVKHNSGEPLKQVLPSLGKYAFCQPHAHGMSSANGVNVYHENGIHRLAPNYGYWVTHNHKNDDWDDHDDTYGIRPVIDLYNVPVYNLSLNTKNMVDLYSEFISTTDFDTVDGWIYGYDYYQHKDDKPQSPIINMRKYTGFTAAQIADFNKKLIETMKNVYAYNPDYDTLSVRTGDAKVDSNPVQFISNLLSVDSALNFEDGKTLNDYVYLGTISVSEYLRQLSLYSASDGQNQIKVTKRYENKTITIPHLQLTPNFTYLGKPSGFYLITSLTYNTSAPSELADSLEFKDSGILVVKHHDGTNTFIKGIPNKKTLYGFSSDYRKLVKLDVSNYTIDVEGKLSLNDNIDYGTVQISYPVDSNFIKEACSESGHICYPTFKNEFGESEGVCTAKIRVDNGEILNSDTSGNDKYIIIVRQGQAGSVCQISYSFWVINSNGYVYTQIGSEVPVITGKVKGRLLKSHYVNTGALMIDVLKSQSRETLKAIFSDDRNASVPITWNGKTTNMSVTSLWCTTNMSDHITDISDQGYLRFSNGSATDYVELYMLDIDFFNRTFDRKVSIKNATNAVVDTRVTRDYGKIAGHKYSVLNMYKNARLRGTSLTLNDLTYEDSIEGHRLYVKNDLCEYVTSQSENYRNIMYYRSLSDINDATVDRSNYNRTCMLTGPCFTLDNLYK